MLNINTKSNLTDHLFEKLNIEAELTDLYPRNRQGYLIVDCPECNEKECAYVYLNSRQITCNRKNKCGKVTTIWDYIKQKNGISDNWQTYKYLAQKIGLNLPENDREFKQKISKEYKSNNILDLALNFYTSQEMPKNIKEYLEEQRKYSNEDIQKMEIGYNPGYKKLIEFFSQLPSPIFEESVRDTLNFIHLRDDYPIVFPYRNRSGRLLSIYGRTLNPNIEDDKKYINFSTVTKESPFYFDKITKKEVIIVEGFFDCMIARAKGLDNVIGSMQNILSDKQLEILINNKCERIYLALDNDKAGIDGTIKSIEKLLSTNIEVFVVSYPSHIKDLDEYIKKSEDINFIKKDIDNAQSASKWMANYILSKYNKNKTDSARQNAINESLKFFSKINKNISKSDFLNCILEPLNLPKNFADTIQEELLKSKQEEKDKQEIEAYLTEAKSYIENRDLEGLKNLKLPNIQTNKFKDLLEDQYNEEIFKQEINKTSNGLPCSYFYKIGNASYELEIPGGALTILAAATGHGKTTGLINFSYQILQKFIENKENNSIHYFSFEQKREPLTILYLNQFLYHEIKNLNNKLKNKENKIEALSYNNRLAIEKFYRGDESKFHDDGCKSVFTTTKGVFFREYIEKKRIKIYQFNSDEFFVEDLIEYIQILKNETNIKLVCIDYIQELELKNKSAYDSRHEEIKKICRLLEKCAHDTGLPILLAAQFNRDVDCAEKMDKTKIAEGAGIERKAELMIGLWNHTHDSNPQKIILMNIMKGRNIGVGHKIELEYDGNTGVFKSNEPIKVEPIKKNRQEESLDLIAGVGDDD